MRGRCSFVKVIDISNTTTMTRHGTQEYIRIESALPRHLNLKSEDGITATVAGW